MLGLKKKILFCLVAAAVIPQNATAGWITVTNERSKDITVRCNNMDPVTISTNKQAQFEVGDAVLIFRDTASNNYLGTLRLIYCQIVKEKWKIGRFTEKQELGHQGDVSHNTITVYDVCPEKSE